MGKKVLIVGGVAGGASCAARLRRLDESAEIVLFERGEYISYANCGLPYHVGGVIKSRDTLLLQTPEQMKAKFNVDVRTGNEVTSVDRAAKTVAVRRGGETYSESYDTLVLATGSTPLKPPIPGIDSPRILTLWTVPDTDRIRSAIYAQGAKRAVVVGGGFIGVEMAENLRHADLDVTLVEMSDQVMAPLDFEMAQLLHEHIAASGVKLSLGSGVKSFADTNGGVTVTLNSGETIRTDLVLLSIGLKPNTELARSAGLAMDERGGVLVNDHLQTSDENIYAVGDIIDVEDFIDKSRTRAPMAGPANKQGRIAADNIAGGDDRYTGAQATAISKVFDLTAASTGWNEKMLAKKGLAYGKDYERIIITQNSHAGYYPGAVPLTLKLLFSTDGQKLYGAQIVGREGVDKRIDTIAVTIRLGGGVANLKNLELAYAPPYSSAKDPVNMAGFTAENVLKGLVRFAPWDGVEKLPDAVLLDVREDAELMAYELPNATHIPLGQLRGRLGELDRNRTYLVFCSIGVRSYTASRLLMNSGFKHVLLYPAGTRFYQSTHFERETAAAETPALSQEPAGASVPDAALRLDCCGMQCPGPIMRVYETMKGMRDGSVMEVAASDPGFVSDIGAWCRRTGNTLLNTEKRGADYIALVRKGQGSAAAPKSVPAAPAGGEGKTIIVFSGDLDRVLASFIIANGAAAMGRPVTMFFTFWGLNVLRKSEKQPVSKTFVESMFGAMMPRGADRLKLSRMNMGGMGTAMMKRIMNDKNVDSLETLIRKAIQNGVKIVACTMSMDVMGIRAEELIDGVELGGVGAYLGDAEESNVNLFI
jgi:NADPH-dependent 2,4-dienoyl-CoA reductase/sulfur reductase-like enzyme/peroxiredoxin family protein/TusA-related sulfurtransferase/rhodanese-related sulfurtransferase